MTVSPNSRSWVRAKLLSGAAACVLFSGAAAAQPTVCARNLSVDELREAGSEAAALSDEFKTAFAGMTLDRATATVSTVGATLVGSSLANEVSATVDGLRHMVLLRDQVHAPAEREMVLSSLSAQLSDAGVRARKVSIAYGQVARMAYVKEVQELASGAMVYADGLARRWSCR